MKNIQNILKYVLMGGLFLTPFIAFIVPDAMFFPFITGKGFTFRILVEILFGLYLILVFLNPEYRPRMSWITKSVLFFGAAVLVADVLGVNSYKSLWSNYERMEGFVLIAHLVAYYIVLSSTLNTKAMWNKFFNVSIGASVLMSVYGLLQITGNITINQGGVRVDGTFGNATYLAIYLVFHIFLSLYMLAGFAEKKWQKWGYGAIALLETIILYFTATRGAILGLLGGLLLVGILLAWKERENKKIRKIALGTIGGVAILILGFMTLRGTAFVAESPVLSRFSTLSVDEFQKQGRYYVWPMALKGFAEKPVFGWGQENFNFVFNKYYDPGLFGQEEWFDRTHNVILDWLIAGGIVGLLAYLSMFAALFYYLWIRKNNMSVLERSIFTGMIAAYVFHNLFVFDNLVSYMIFFSLLAYIHSRREDTEPKTSAFYTKVITDASASYGVMVAVTLVTVGMIYFINVPALSANKTLIRAMTPQSAGVENNLALFKDVYAYNSFGAGEATEHLTQVTGQISASQTIPAATKQTFYDFTKQKIEEKVASSPHDARYLVFAGNFFNRFGKYDEAIPYLERALAESPKKQTIYFELGTSYLGKGNNAKMFELFKMAYDLKPENESSKLLYAIGAIYTKNAVVLADILPQIDPQVVATDNRILRAYAAVGDSNAIIAILKERIRLNPADTQSKLSLASTYASIGQRQNAINIIREMIAEDPSFKKDGEAYIGQIQRGELE